MYDELYNMELNNIVRLTEDKFDRIFAKVQFFNTYGDSVEFKNVYVKCRIYDNGDIYAAIISSRGDFIAGIQSKEPKSKPEHYKRVKLWSVEPFINNQLVEEYLTKP